jgi:RNA polymerase subunit RPABC4/transcription elongation factor Spt4
MALIKCTECGKDISSLAPACPSCGAPQMATAGSKPTSGVPRVVCPKCGSDQLTAKTRGFALGRALVGDVVLGPLGLLVGAVGRRKIKITCLACGHTFKPGAARKKAAPSGTLQTASPKTSTAGAVAGAVFLGLIILSVLGYYVISSTDKTAVRSDEAAAPKAGLTNNPQVALQTGQPNSEILSRPAQSRVGPSFECRAKLNQSLAQIICASDELARVELSYVIKYQALQQSLDDQGRATLRNGANAFVLDVAQQCNIPNAGTLGRAPTQQEIGCIKGQYESEQQKVLRRTSGDALEEAKLEPEEALAIQEALQSRNFLPKSAAIDGFFGPITRTAVASWQRSVGQRDTGYGSKAMLPQLAVSDGQSRILSSAGSSDGRKEPVKPTLTVESGADGWRIIGKQGVVTFVAINKSQLKNQDNYRRAADEICAGKSICHVGFWVAGTDIPKSLPMTDAQVSSEVVQWAFNANTGLRRFLWSCKVFQDKSKDECF